MIDIKLFPHLDDINVEKEFKAIGYSYVAYSESWFVYSAKIGDKEHQIEIYCTDNVKEINSVLLTYKEKHGEEVVDKIEVYHLTPFQIQLIWIKLYQMKVL